MVQLTDAPSGLTRLLLFLKSWLRLRLGKHGDTDLSAELAALFGDCALSKSSLPILGMGRDIPDGRMMINDDGFLEVSWRLQKQGDFFKRMRATMKAVAGAMGADFKDAVTLRLSRVITVHPLGGCPMSEHADLGVVDAFGQVHGHPGLFIADGSVMPGPVGPNPALTIAALANRFATRMLNDRARSVQVPCAVDEES